MNTLIALIFAFGSLPAVAFSHGHWRSDAVDIIIGGVMILVALAAAFDYVPPGFGWLVRIIGKGLCGLGLHEPMGPSSFMTRGLAEKIQTEGYNDHCIRCGADIHWFPLGDESNNYESRLR